MSEAGLPGAGVKLGSELFRSPKGNWFSGVAADGAAVGVLRFDPETLRGEGALPALIERVVAVRAGRVPGGPEVVDLVEDDGKVWLITAEVPVEETAARVEESLFAPEAAAPAEAAQSADGAPAEPVPDVAQPPPVQVVVVPRDSRVGLVVRAAIGTVLVGAIVVGAFVAGNRLRSKPRNIKLRIAGVSVVTPGGYTATSICTASLPMKAVIQTNGGTGTLVFEWVFPGMPPVKMSKQLTGNTTQEMSTTWKVNLHGKGTATAKFVVDDTAVLASGVVATTTTAVDYQCP